MSVAALQASPRVTAANTAQRHKTTAKKAVSGDGLIAIFRTSGHVAAIAADEA